MLNQENKFEFFYKFYDNMFIGQKDYLDEINKVLKIFQLHHQFEQLNKINNVLEIGIGTGNHLIPMSQHVHQITGIDIDENMVNSTLTKLLKYKINNVTLISKIIEQCNFQPSSFDLVYSLFNVINYVKLSSLSSFFENVYLSLINNGLFIFDCWNGIAAIKDPPKNSYREFDFDDEKINLELTPNLNLMSQKVDLFYNFKFTNSPDKKNYLYNFSQYLHTPKEISYSLEKCGFKILNIVKFFDPKIKANENDWKIVFICSK